LINTKAQVLSAPAYQPPTSYQLEQPLVASTAAGLSQFKQQLYPQMQSAPAFQISAPVPLTIPVPTVQTVAPQQTPELSKEQLI